MQPVYHTRNQLGSTPPWVAAVLLALMAATGVGVLALGLWLVWHDVHDGASVMMALLADGIFCLPGIVVLLVTNGLMCRAFGRFRFEAEGLAVQYPFRRERLIPWDAFQQVCVCYGLAVYKGEKHPPVVICCVKHGEKKNIYDRWKTDSPLRYGRVLCIDYTQALHLGICERCPYPVADLRKTPAYRVYDP